MNFLVSEFVTFFLIFVRVSAAIFSAPVIGGTAFPTMAKLGLGVIISYMVLFTVPEYAFSYDQGLFLLFFLGVKEFLVGLIMGFTLSIVFHAMLLAGHIISYEMSLMMANVFDPFSEVQSNIMGQLMNLTAIIIFLIINGHHYLIRSIAVSFQLIGIGNIQMNSSIYELLYSYTAGIFVIAVKISAPIIVAYFLLHVSAALIARMIPQMQIFFVMLPLKVALGFFLLVSGMSIITFYIRELLYQFEDNLLKIIQAMS